METQKRSCESSTTVAGLLRYLHVALNMCRKQSTLSIEDTPPFFRLPHIHTGYRPAHKPLKYYLYSIFQIHNETLNVWTHFGAFFLFVYMCQKYSRTMDIINDPMCWGYLTFTVGPLAYSIFSSLAHLFHSQSAKEHYLCFQLDYLGIGLATYGTAAGTYFFAGNEAFYQSYIGSIFIPTYTILSSSICIVLSYGRMKFSKNHPLAHTLIAVGAMGVAFFYALVPICYTFRDSLLFTDWSHFWTWVFPHLEYFAYFAFAGIFFGSHIPERFCKGYFDILGQAHQIFHVLMAYYSYKQFINLYDMYKIRSTLDWVHVSNPGLHNTLLPLLLIVVTNVWFIYRTDSTRQRCAEEEYHKIKHR